VLVVSLGAQYLALAGYEPEDMIEVLSLLKDQEQYITTQVLQELGQTVGISYHASSTAMHPSSDVRLQEVILAAESYLKNEDVQADRRDYLMMLDGMAVDDSQRYVMEPSAAKLQNISSEFKGYFPYLFNAYVEKTLPKQEHRVMLPANEQALDLIALDSIEHSYAVYDKEGQFDGYSNETSKAAVLIRVLDHNGSQSAKQVLLQYLENNSHQFANAGGEAIKTPYGTGFFMRSIVTRDYQELGFIGKTVIEQAKHMHGVVLIEDKAIILETYGDVFNFKQMPHALIFKSMMRNIRPSNADNTFHDKVPEYDYGVALKTVEPGETFKSIAQNIIMEDVETKLRLINGFYPSGEPEFGQTIKVFADKSSND